MRPDQRQERIVALVHESERVSVERLADIVGASRETIRRDLADLDRRGRVRKFHGGATTPDPAVLEPDREGPFQARLSQNAVAKRAVARRAIQLFRPGETLFIDTGTTTLFFAEELAHTSGLTIITNSSMIAALAARGASNAVFTIGGAFRVDGGESVGAAAVEQIGRFHADHAVLSVGSVSDVGLLDYDVEEANVARAMVAQARSVTALADASKFGRGGSFKIAALGAVSRIVTDLGPGEAFSSALRQAGTDVVLA